MYILPLAFLSISSKCLSQLTVFSSRVNSKYLEPCFRLMDGLYWVEVSMFHEQSFRMFLFIFSTIRFSFDHNFIFSTSSAPVSSSSWPGASTVMSSANLQSLLIGLTGLSHLPLLKIVSGLEQSPQL